MTAFAISANCNRLTAILPVYSSTDLIGFLITNAYPVGDTTPASRHERALQEAYQLLLETIFNGESF